MERLPRRGWKVCREGEAEGESRNGKEGERRCYGKCKPKHETQTLDAVLEFSMNINSPRSPWASVLSREIVLIVLLLAVYKSTTENEKKIRAWQFCCEVSSTTLVFGGLLCHANLKARMGRRRRRSH